MVRFHRRVRGKLLSQNPMTGAFDRRYPCRSDPCPEDGRAIPAARAKTDRAKRSIKLSIACTRPSTAPPPSSYFLTHHPKSRRIHNNRVTTTTDRPHKLSIAPRAWSRELIKTWSVIQCNGFLASLEVPSPTLSTALLCKLDLGNFDVDCPRRHRGIGVAS